MSNIYVRVAQVILSDQRDFQSRETIRAHLPRGVTKQSSLARANARAQSGSGGSGQNTIRMAFQKSLKFFEVRGYLIRRETTIEIVDRDGLRKWLDGEDRP